MATAAPSFAAHTQSLQRLKEKIVMGAGRGDGRAEGAPYAPQQQQQQQQQPSQTATSYDRLPTTHSLHSTAPVDEPPRRLGPGGGGGGGGVPSAPPSQRARAASGMSALTMSSAGGGGALRPPSRSGSHVVSSAAPSTASHQTPVATPRHVAGVVSQGGAGTTSAVGGGGGGGGGPLRSDTQSSTSLLQLSPVEEPAAHPLPLRAAQRHARRHSTSPPQRDLLPPAGGSSDGAAAPVRDASLPSAAYPQPQQPPRAASASQQQLAAATDATTAAAAHARMAVLEAELQEAGVLIKDLGTQMEEQAAAVRESRRRRDVAEEDAKMLRVQHAERERAWEREVAELKAKMAETDAAAKEALELREAHHEREKQEMLEVYQQLVAEINAKDSDLVDGRLRATAATGRLAAAESQREGLLESMLSQRDELRQHRWEVSAEGNEEYRSLLRKFDHAAAEHEAAQQQLADARALNDVLTAKLRDADLAQEGVALELSLLQDEYDRCVKAHAENIQTLQRTHQTMREEAGQADRVKRLARKLKDAEDRELKQRCDINELTEELAFLTASKEDDARATARLKEEIVGLKAVAKSMEGGWQELEALRVTVHDLRADLDAARKWNASARDGEEQLQLRITSLAGERQETLGTLAAARQHMQELEAILEDYHATLRPLRARVLPTTPASLGGNSAPDRPLKTVVDHCLAVVDERDALVADLKRLQAEHRDITAGVADMQRQLAEHKIAAEDAMRQLRDEQVAHAALAEGVDATHKRVDEYEASAKALEARAADDQKAAAAAREAQYALEQDLAEASKKIVQLQGELDDRARDAASLKKSLLAKVSLYREEERAASTTAILDLQGLVGKNRALNALVDKLEADLMAVRSAVVEALQVVKQQRKTNDQNQTLIANLRATSEQQQGIFEDELHAMQKQLNEARLEVNTLRQSADAAAAELLDAKKRLCDADRFRSEKEAAQSLVQTYQLAQQESRREVDVLLNQKNVSDEELSRAAAQVQELRAKLAEARDAQQRAMEENSSLTTQLCSTRQDAQAQQRLLLEELKALRQAVG